MEQTDPQFETIYAPPFTGPMPEGVEGQWFNVPGIGYYWTDTTGLVGLLSLGDVADAITKLNADKRVAQRTGRDAHDVFNDLLETAQDRGLPIDLVDGSLDDLRAEYMSLVESGESLTAAGAPEPEEYGITLDDAGNVLELVKTAPDGVYIRENGDWTKLDPNAEEDENDTVYGREWVDVDESAINIYDQNAGADSLTRDNFTPLIAK